MKVLLINKFHYPKGGSEKVYFDTKELLEKNGHEVFCFSMRDDRNLPCPEEKYFVGHVDFQSRDHWFKKFFRYLYYPAAAAKLDRLIADKKPDLAHIHNFSHQLTSSILSALKKRQVPVVQTLHDYQLICPNYRLFTNGRVCERCRKHRYYNTVFRRCAQNSVPASILAALELVFQWLFRLYREKVDLFVSPSEFLKNKMSEWGVKNKILTVNNFIDFQKFEPNFAPGDYSVCVSRLSKEKGIMTLLRAIRKLPAIKMKLIGDGPMQETVKNYIMEKQIRNVEYLGAKFGDELLSLIRQARFFIIPSDWYENYPMSVLEAMALGKPVLAANIGGLNEMVSEGQTGWFFTAGDIKDLRNKIKLANSLGNDELERIGRNARLAVEQKNCSDVYYQKLMSAYNKVLPASKALNLG